MKVLVTCPPMLGMIDSFRQIFDCHDVELTAPRVVQTLLVEELIRLVPQHDGWIIGDDPATCEVFTAGKSGRLKAAVKWGIGVDNVDFDACRKLNIPITNTPSSSARLGPLNACMTLALLRNGGGRVVLFFSARELFHCLSTGCREAVGLCPRPSLVSNFVDLEGVMWRNSQSESIGKTT